jgi:hypothetical protein
MQVEETTQSSPLRPTRAGFVRGLPLTMPVEEVIERGREVGIQLQPSDIHAARYYMRQQQAAGGTSIPQQLLLGGTFTAKRGNGNQAHAVDGANANGANGINTSAALENTGAVDKGADDDDFAQEQAAVVAAPKRRKIVQSKAVQQLIAGTKENAQAVAQTKGKDKDKDKEKDNGSNGSALHDRLQARLANATFRETSREEKRSAREEQRSAREEQRSAREEQRSAREAQRSAREERQAERQNERQSARTKQERAARQERLDKATIGKALLDAESVKSRNKRAVQSTDKLEEQARLIALRLGTQRVRELLDEMEALARQA